MFQVFASKIFNPPQLVLGFRRWLQEEEFAAFRHLQIQVSDEQSLAVAKAPAFPFHLAIGNVEACENAVAHAVNVAVPQDRI